ncbi:hypothetical protein D3C76_1337780 [compost metagenome]
MKQTRNTYSFTLLVRSSTVTFGLVAEVVINGTFFSCATGTAPKVLVEVTGPISATTLSLEISLCAARVASSDLEALSA